MPGSMNAKLSQLKFPPTCVVCMSPAANHHEIEKTFNYGRRSYTVKVKVPMCDSHAEAARFKGPVEKIVNGLAVFGGISLGIIAAILLFIRWVGEVSIIAKIFGSGLFGFGAFIIFWWITTASIAPFFATPQSKEARNAVQIGMYWPKDKIVRLDFENEQLAEMVRGFN